MRFGDAEKKRLLVVCILAGAGLSIILLILSLSNEHWLHTREKYHWDTGFLSKSYNGSDVYLSTHYGLWKVCTFFTDLHTTPITTPECSALTSKNDAGNEVTETREEDDTLMNGIILSSRKTFIFPIVSIILEVTAALLCLMGYFIGRKRYFIFITGCLFVTSGMSLLAASILFMGAVTSIANHKPRVQLGDPEIFEYKYAASFFMLNAAFCLDELSGVLSVYLFIIRHKEVVKRRHARLSVHKSKAARMHLFVRRHSRLQSASTACGEMSRRSSNNVPEPEMVPQLDSQRAVQRDISHMTQLTTVESREDLNETAVPLVPNHTEIKENNSINHKITDYNSISDSVCIAPPKEFQSTNCLELSPHRGNNCYNSYNCKTTSV